MDHGPPTDGRQAVEQELAATRRRLRRSRKQLNETRAQLRAAREQIHETSYRYPPDVEAVIEQVLADHLTLMKAANLRDLAAIVGEAEREGVPGLVVEAGTAAGGSAIVLAAAKSRQRSMKVFDVFGMIPPPSGRDGEDVHRRYRTIVEGKATGIGGRKYYGYRDNLYDEVVVAFERLGLAIGENNVELVPGLFEDTVRLDEPVAFAHLDGDWYESTLTCLSRIAPLLVPGGRLVVDDYYHWSGCRTAVNEYFSGRDGYRIEFRSRVQVIRA